MDEPEMHEVLRAGIEASERGETEDLGCFTQYLGDPCPACNQADLVPTGGKHRCPACGYLQPCCNP